MNRLIKVALIMLAAVLTPVGRADGINLPVQPLGIVNAAVGITPVEDAFMPGGQGFGRIFLGYVLNFPPRQLQLPHFFRKSEYFGYLNMLRRRLHALRGGRHILFHSTFNHHTSVESDLAYSRRRRILCLQCPCESKHADVRTRHVTPARNRLCRSSVALLRTTTWPENLCETQFEFRPTI